MYKLTDTFVLINFWFLLFFIIAYTTLNKLFAVFYILYISKFDVGLVFLFSTVFYEYIFLSYVGFIRVLCKRLCRKWKWFLKNKKSLLICSEYIERLSLALKQGTRCNKLYSLAAARKADHVAYNVGCSYRTEPPKNAACEIALGHVTTLPMAIPDAEEISAVRFFRCVLWMNDTSYSDSVSRSE